MKFNGIGTHLGNLSRLSDAENRAVNMENPIVVNPAKAFNSYFTMPFPKLPGKNELEII